MKYLGLLAAKLAGLAVALHYVWVFGSRLLPPPRMVVYGRSFGYDLPWTLAVFVFFLICCAALFWALYDQRYRCRVCLRRLRMPVARGSWGQMLEFGRPRTEYICPYGHGTLRVADLQISGLEPGDWTRHDDDIWRELETLEKR